MKQKIRNIATVHSGIYAKPEFEGDVYYVQARNFNEQLDFDFSVKPDLQMDKKVKNNLLTPGDVLLAVRGSNNFAVHYRGKIYPAVASTMFVVIRPTNQKLILPDFLTWYLNLPHIQKLLQSKAQSTSIPSLNKAIVEELEVSIPSIKKQELIIKFAALKKLETSLLKQLNELKEQQLEHLLLSTL